MKPGRELDALIAEKVMGWTKTPAKYHATGGFPGQKQEVLHESSIDILAPADFNFEHNFQIPNLPRYSTDIAAAWEIVEKMWPSYAFYLRKRYKQEGWCAGFSPSPYESSIAAYAEELTAPHAICLAALNTVGV